MKYGLIYFASFFLFQIAAAQGNDRSIALDQSLANLMANEYKSEMMMPVAKNFIKTGPVTLSRERLGFTTTSAGPGRFWEGINPFLSSIFALHFIHVPGFLVGFPIPYTGLFNRQKMAGAGQQQMKMNGGLLNGAHNAGVIMNF